MLCTVHLNARKLIFFQMARSSVKRILKFMQNLHCKYKCQKQKRKRSIGAKLFTYIFCRNLSAHNDVHNRIILFHI